MTRETHEPDHEFDDVPWADPAIRTNYEAALGRLILAHNDVDLHLTRLIEKCLEQLGNPVELKKLANGMFASRLNNARIMKSLLPKMSIFHGVDFDELENLNQLRNIVAHGHFEQNPFQGDYQLITRKDRHDDFSTERLEAITSRLDNQAKSLKVAIWFEDLEDLD